jgi:hypothetical protein
MSPDMLESLYRGLDTSDTPTDIFAAPQDIRNRNGYIIIPKGTMFAVFGDVVRYQIGEKIKQLRADSTAWKKLTDSGRLTRQRLPEDAEDDFEDVDWNEGFERIQQRGIRPARSKMVWVLGGSAAAILVAVGSIMALGGGSEEVRAADGERNIPAVTTRAIPVVGEAVEVEKLSERWLAYEEGFDDEGYGGYIYIYIEKNRDGTPRIKLYPGEGVEDYILDEIDGVDFNIPNMRFPGNLTESDKKEALELAKKGICKMKGDELYQLEYRLNKGWGSLTHLESKPSDVRMKFVVPGEENTAPQSTASQAADRLPEKMRVNYILNPDMSNFKIRIDTVSRIIDVNGELFSMGKEHTTLQEIQHRYGSNVTTRWALQQEVKKAICAAYISKGKPAPTYFENPIVLEER